MSDDDDFMQASDDENYDFEYEDDDDQEEGGDVDVENKYYNAKQMKADNPEDAIDEFLGVPALEPEKGDWGFKGLKQAIKLEFKLGRYEMAVEHYTELLTYVKSAVTRNYSEKSINNMLDFIEKNAEDEQAHQCIEKFYSKTLDSFQATNNERLWLATNTKLARLWLAQKDYPRLTEKVRELHQACQREDGSDDPSKGTYSMEAYALEIQMYADTRNNKRLKGLYNRAIGVRSAVPHPKIMGIIRECGGKMFMSEENWKAAQSAFFESFRSYDEAGSMQRIQVLKYLVLTTMLMGSDINPLLMRISVTTSLNPFIAENIDEVTRNMRTKAVVKLVAPYTRFRLDFIAKRLSISIAEVQDIVGFLIMDKKLRGKINQDAGTVEIESRADQDRMTAVADWTTAIRSLANFVLNEGDGFKSDDAMGGLGGSGLVAPPMPGGGSSMSSLQRGTNTGKRKSNRGAVPVPKAPTKHTGEKEPYAEHLEALACFGERLCIVTAWALQQEAL
ncbi:COP9 signalosome complex subunit [Hortaea werneckii]|nr:COP9 signalosome complex subunit [Hortaea werneckii]